MNSTWTLMHSMDKGDIFEIVDGDTVHNDDMPMPTSDQMLPPEFFDYFVVDLPTHLQPASPSAGMMGQGQGLYISLV